MRLHLRYIVFAVTTFLLSILWILLFFEDPLPSNVRHRHQTQTQTQTQTARIPHEPWIRFEKLNDATFVYTSFVDRRNGNKGYPFYRIILIKSIVSPKKVSSRYFCTFGNERVEGELYEMAENHGQTFGTFILSCKIPASIGIDNVQMLTLDNDDDSSLLIKPAYDIPEDGSIKKYQLDYAICVPFLHGDHYTGQHLVEFIELNKLLGAKRITIYTKLLSLNKGLQEALLFYIENGLVEVVEFEVPVQRIWYFAQLVTITDCLYRYVGITQFLSFHDIDEYIIPTTESDLPSLLSKIFNSTIGSYRVPTRYFQMTNQLPITLNSLKADRELDTRFTKCVVRPEYVFEQGIHHTSRVIQDHYLTLHLDSKYATLHHYKEWRRGEEEDKIIVERYGERLWTNYQKSLMGIQISAAKRKA